MGIISGAKDILFGKEVDVRFWVMYRYREMTDVVVGSG